MLNKVTLIGRLGADPEVRYMPTGGAVANITLATNFRWKDKAGEKKETTEWHRVVFFNRLAEIAGEYLKKVVRFTLKDVCKLVNGKVRTVKIATQLKLLPLKCTCWIVEVVVLPTLVVIKHQRGILRKHQNRPISHNNPFKPVVLLLCRHHHLMKILMMIFRSDQCPLKLDAIFFLVCG